MSKKKRKKGGLLSITREIFVGVAIAVSTSGILWIAAKTTQTVQAVMGVSEDLDRLYAEVSETRELAQSNQEKMLRLMELISERGEDGR